MCTSLCSVHATRVLCVHTKGHVLSSRPQHMSSIVCRPLSIMYQHEKHLTMIVWSGHIFLCGSQQLHYLIGVWLVFDCLWYNSFVTDQCQFILQRLCLGYKGRVYKFYDCRQRLMPQQTAVWDLCSCVKFSWLPMHDYEVHSHIQDVSIHVDSRVGPTKLTWSPY